MDTFEAIKRRRSIRSFKNEPIDKKTLLSLIEAARFAPTARNVQPWEFVVATEAATLQKLAQLCENGRFISQAKACIAVFCQDTKYYLEDGCAATQNIMLAAASLGIGSCWVAGDKKPYCPEVASLLGVPQGYKLVSLIALGYPLSEGELKAVEKRKTEEITHWEKF